MARTSSLLVAGIIETDVTITLDPFILAASELVTEKCAGAGYSDERLELIERFLAAHFYTLRDPRPVTEKAGSVGVTHQSKVDLNLATSHYGQHAMVLDTAGGLARLNHDISNPRSQRTGSLTWAGTEPE